MRWYYKVFWIMFFIEVAVTPFLLIQFYLTGVNLVALYKIPLLLSFGTIFYFHLVNSFRWRALNILFLVGGSFSLIFGVYQNYATIDSKILPSLYTFLMPIFAISFGIHFAKEYNITAKRFVYKYMNLAFIMTILVLILYLVFYYSGQIPYYGFATKIDFIGAFSISSASLPQYLICLVFAILSGKRATTITTCFVLLVYYSDFVTKVSLKKTLYFIPFFVLFAFAFNYAQSQNMFRRFNAVAKFDLKDRRSTYLATGGRWQEVEGVAKFLNKESYKWYTGGGMGAKYDYYDFATDSYWKKHYSHITPLGYTFLYGVVFTGLLYFFLISLIIKGFRKKKNFYYLAFVILIIGSSFGANLFVDHKIWVLIGVVYTLVNDKKDELPISYLNLK